MSTARDFLNDVGAAVFEGIDDSEDPVRKFYRTYLRTIVLLQEISTKKFSDGQFDALASIVLKQHYARRLVERFGEDGALTVAKRVVRTIVDICADLDVGVMTKSVLIPLLIARLRERTPDARTDEDFLGYAVYNVLDKIAFYGGDDASALIGECNDREMLERLAKRKKSETSSTTT